MILVSFLPLETSGDEGKEEIKVPSIGVLLENGIICDLSNALPAQWQPLDAINFLKRGNDAIRRAEEAVREGNFRLPVSSVKMISPIQNPGQVITVNDNYPSSPSVQPEAEQGNGILRPESEKDSEDNGLAERRRPKFFTKYITQSYGNGAHVPKQDSVAMGFGGELAVIIGRTCARVYLEEAMDHVAGIAAAHDFACRDWSTSNERWLHGKAYDAPILLGPGILTRDSVDPANLTLRTKLNGKLLQEVKTGTMLFTIAQLIQDISLVMTLEPGDILLTGTPPLLPDLDAAPVIEVGDLVEVSLEDAGLRASCIVSQAEDV